jgi:DNA polymerase III subunit delta
LRSHNANDARNARLKLPYAQLERSLAAGLSGIYLIAGEEPLFVGEALARIREAAQARGFTERELFVVERGFDWARFEAESDSLSLFAERRVIELRLASPKPGDAGARAIKALAEREDPDRLFLIGIAAKLDAAAQRSTWVKAIEGHGTRVDIWPLQRNELPRFLASRAATYGVSLSPAALELLADRSEGNLLAADQELRKLSLAAVSGQIDEEQVLGAVGQNARFDVFRLGDALVAGDATRALRILFALRAEGAQPALVAWGIAREIGTLAELVFGAPALGLDAALKRAGVWPRRQPVVKAALRRLGEPEIRRLLAQAASVDGIVKGARPGLPWEAVQALALEFLARNRARVRGAGA